jgi:regulator of cell morphogenesis and NO signaling
MTAETTGLPVYNIAEIPLTIGEMVAKDYRKAEVFRKYGIDYCCGGKKPLEEVCLKKGIDPESIRKELAELDQQPERSADNHEEWAPDTLTMHIIDKHHRYVNDALPMLQELTAKVARVHGQRHPELVTIARLFDELASELRMHMHKEEQILFPYIDRMAAALRAGEPAPQPFFGTVENPIRMMENEHESAGENMEEIRLLSSNFTPPEGACTSYRVLFAKLQEFEQDLHRHVHLENNILFSKALRMEKDAFAA